MEHLLPAGQFYIQKPVCIVWVTSIYAKKAFDALYLFKDEIEAKLGTALQWNRGDDIKSSKVFIQLDDVSIENEEDWPQMAKFHAEWSKRFYDVLVPYIEQAWN